LPFFFRPSNRYIDLTSKPFLQRRYDDPMKRRKVKRTVKKKSISLSFSPLPPPIPYTQNPLFAAQSQGAKAAKKLDIEVDDQNTKITKITQRKSSTEGSDSTDKPTEKAPPETLTPSASSESLNLKKLGHQSLPGCPSHWSDEEGMDYYELNVPSGSQEFRWAADMLHKTTASYHLNNPANHKITFSKLVCTKVVRVQNPALWLRLTSFFLSFSFFLLLWALTFDTNMFIFL